MMNKMIFDIGGSNIKFAVMTVKGDILVKDSMPTNKESAEGFFKVLETLAEKYRNGVDQISVSTNGRMQEDGVTYRSDTLRFLKNVNLQKEMERRCGLPVKVLNDGSAAVLGEWQFGAGRGCENLLALVLGTGIGGGLVLNGRLYEGSHKNSSAVFNMINGFNKENYRYANLETSIYFPMYKLADEKNLPKDQMTGEVFFRYVEQGDPYAIELIYKYCREIAMLAYNSAMLLDLDKIIITGGLAGQPVIERKINEILKEIPEDYMAIPFIKKISSVALIDPDEIKVQVTQGNLTSDANLYGALYYALL